MVMNFRICTLPHDIYLTKEEKDTQHIAKQMKSNFWKKPARTGTTLENLAHTE